ncbi:MAG: glycosyltransferase family 2 protein [Agriterribacter sp.]
MKDLLLPPKVAILILNWNTSGYLKRFLPSVLNTTYTNSEVYVIDNNSNDDSVEMLKKDFPNVNIIRMFSNKGYASGYNLCLTDIKADYYLLVNSDIEVTPSFIEPVIELMEADPLIGICQPKLLCLDARDTFEYAGACGGWIDQLGFPFTRGRVLLTIEKDELQYDNVEQIFWATGACMFLKSDVYEKIGGFYDYYYMHQEDIDLCWRAQNAGYKIYVCPQSKVYHIGGGSLSWENHLKTFLTFRNNYILLTRNLRLLQLLYIIPLRMLLDLGGCIFFLINGKAGISKAIFKAQFAYLYWILFVRNKRNHQPRGYRNCFGVYKSTILISYFLKKKRKFLEIVPLKPRHKFQNAEFLHKKV